MISSTEEDLIRRVEALAKNTGGYIKVNIPGEGLWAALLRAEDRATYNKNSRGDTIHVVLANDPINMAYKYGHIYPATTNGGSRPTLSGATLGQYNE